jgi:adenylate kinase family enzyme
MPFVYITGAPGVGKTTLQKELNSRHLIVYDIDDHELGGAHNKSSGKRVLIPSAEDRAPEWYDEHEWRIDYAAINSLKDKATNETIFVCGVAPDDETIIGLFDRIFYIDLDENNLKQRITARTDNDYGKNPNELIQIIERKKKLDARYAASDATIVNGKMSPREIADYILAQTKL